MRVLDIYFPILIGIERIPLEQLTWNLAAARNIATF